jgi:hypothetical protein
MLPVRAPRSLAITAPARLSWFPQDSVRDRRRNYTWEGAAIGAGVLGTLGGLFIGGLCGDSDSQDSCVGAYVGGALTSAFIGGIIGGIIGGNIPKGPADVPANKRLEPGGR